VSPPPPQAQRQPRHWARSMGLHVGAHVCSARVHDVY
jgi:hypothetical protein